MLVPWKEVEQTLNCWFQGASNSAGILCQESQRPRTSLTALSLAWLKQVWLQPFLTMLSGGNQDSGPLNSCTQIPPRHPAPSILCILLASDLGLQCSAYTLRPLPPSEAWEQLQTSSPSLMADQHHCPGSLPHSRVPGDGTSIAAILMGRGPEVPS